MRDERFDALLAETATLAREFAAAGKSLFLVGGIVRDTLIGRVRAELDIDLTTDALPDEIEVIVRRSGPTALWTQGRRFGTIGATIVGPNGPRAFEITTHRAEQYHDDSRKPDVRFSTDINLDLSRRDFTVNAVAFEVQERRLLDPFGGERDLADRILRTPLSAEISFSDDPLRMLRAARFLTALNLAPDPSVTDAVVALKDRMAIVSAERIRGELFKLLELDVPSVGLRFLLDTGLISTFLPELVGPNEARLVARVRAMEPVWPRRFGALLFGAFGSQAAMKSRLRQLKCSVDEESVMTRIQHLSEVDLEAVGQSDGATRRFVVTAGSELQLFLDLVKADALAGLAVLAVPVAEPATAPLTGDPVAEPATGPLTGEPDAHETIAILERLRFRLRLLAESGELEELGPALNGEDVMDLLGLAPGREVGEALDMLRELRLDNGRVSRADAEVRLMEWFDRRRSERG